MSTSSIDLKKLTVLFLISPAIIALLIFAAVGMLFFWIYLIVSGRSFVDYFDQAIDKMMH